MPAKVRFMEMKLELVAVPVTDVDRAKTFYVEQVGFVADHDHQVSETLRFVQLTPPGSACSIAIGDGVTQMPPGSQKGLQMVVADADAADVLADPADLAPDEALGPLRGRRDHDAAGAASLARVLAGRDHDAVVQHLDLQSGIRHARIVRAGP